MSEIWIIITIAVSVPSRIGLGVAEVVIQGWEVARIRGIVKMAELLVEGVWEVGMVGHLKFE